jgi:hypothetical protein
MADHTEVYLCKAGQSLENAKIDFAQHVMSRHEAEQDAIERCRADASLVKLVYYMVNDEGKFRSIYAHENTATTPPPAPKPAGVPSGETTAAQETDPPKEAPAKRPRSILLRGLMSLLTEEVR